MDRLFTHTQFSSADVSSPTVWRFSALCHLHRLCASIHRLCIVTVILKKWNSVTFKILFHQIVKLSEAHLAF